MSKKHFVMFAKKIAELTDREAARVAALIVCEVALESNTAFDAALFLKACGLERE